MRGAAWGGEGAVGSGGGRMVSNLESISCFEMWLPELQAVRIS